MAANCRTIKIVRDASANNQRQVQAGPTVLVHTETCPVCHKGGTVTVPLAGLKKYRGGELIQRAMPTVTADVREQLMTGIHGECWEKMFSNDKEI